MLIEVERFVEVSTEWFNHEPRRREDLVFEPMTVNPRYVGWLQRYPVGGGIEFCEVGLVDWRKSFVIAKTYEETKALLARAA